MGFNWVVPFICGNCWTKKSRKKERTNRERHYHFIAFTKWKLCQLIIEHSNSLVWFNKMNHVPSVVFVLFFSAHFAISFIKVDFFIVLTSTKFVKCERSFPFQFFSIFNSGQKLWNKAVISWRRSKLWHKFLIWLLKSGTQSFFVCMFHSFRRDDFSPRFRLFLVSFLYFVATVFVDEDEAKT